MTAWTQVGPGANLDGLLALATQIQGVLDAIGTALEAIAAIIDILAALATLTINLLSAIVSAIINAIEQLVLDMFEYNVALAVHTNINWDPKWRYDRDTLAGEGAEVNDFVNDGSLPWTGGGTDGWLLDLLTSSQDESDPFRPVTDAGTQIRGIIVMNGVSNNGELEDLKSLYDLFTDFSDFKDALDIKKTLEETSESIAKSVSRAGSAFSDGFWRTLNAQGPPSLRGYNEFSDYVPKLGSYPKWLSVPVAALFPATKKLFEGLRKALGMLRPSLGLADAFVALAAAIKARVELIRAALAEITGLIETLVTLLVFFSSAYIIVIDEPEGGMNAFINTALSGEGKPFFGTGGIVAGFTVLATNPDAQKSLDLFMETLGMPLQNFSDQATELTDKLDDTYEELFLP